mmetsp:Transcript_10028/g.15167  ORF Transcript_10028/g.15167 Transcript_10028/m.15167 type:complete len:317 (+) Transcript_10028:17-967(+)
MDVINNEPPNAQLSTMDLMSCICFIMCMVHAVVYRAQGAFTLLVCICIVLVTESIISTSRCDLNGILMITECFSLGRVWVHVVWLYISLIAGANDKFNVSVVSFMPAYLYVLGGLGYYIIGLKLQWFVYSDEVEEFYQRIFMDTPALLILFNFSLALSHGPAKHLSRSVCYSLLSSSTNYIVKGITDICYTGLCVSLNICMGCIGTLPVLLLHYRMVTPLAASVPVMLLVVLILYIVIYLAYPSQKSRNTAPLPRDRIIFYTMLGMVCTINVILVWKNQEFDFSETVFVILTSILSVLAVASGCSLFDDYRESKRM